VLSGSRRCAVLGSPVRHSLSPVLHRAAYADLGLDWVYEAHELPEMELPGFLAELDDSWRGLSLTMPLKRAVMPLLDDASDRALQSGAANTLVLEGGRRTGHNTDIPGAVAAIRERHEGALDRAVIVGGGATATSTLFGLADLGCRHVTLMVRDRDRAAATVATAARHPHPPVVDVRLLGEGPVEAEILVTTIPATAQTPDVVRLADAVPVVFEVLYDPWPTPVAASALRTGRTLIGGLDLLVHQAVRQVELMTGAPDTQRGNLARVMRRAGQEALEQRWSASLVEEPSRQGEASRNQWRPPG
jgi:shikimate dehydrogenase